jgi:hypothetical protein
MAKGKHSFDEDILNKHVQTGGIDGGKCLNRHISPYQENNSCSHRWQAYKRALDDPQLYNDKAYEAAYRVPGKRVNYWTPWFQRSERVSRRRPNPGDWDLGEYTKFDNGGKVPNFRKSCKWPYYHNSHHIIPNGVLNGSILDVAKKAKSYTLYRCIRIGLLDATYNLNHKVNMFLLPMSKFVANVLCLPRHIAGVEADPAMGEVGYVVAHPVYSAKVKRGVDQIMQEYAAALDQATEAHDAPPHELSKKRLEAFSKQIYEKTKLWGKRAKGLSLDVMNPEAFIPRR